MAKAKSESKKKAPVSPSRDERAAALKEKFNKEYKGKAVIKPASEFVLPYLTKRLPTGLLTLDLALRGGFPAGGLSQIVGPKNAGKSWLTWQVIRQLQYYLGDKMKVLLAMTEMRADRGQARLAGVKISLGNEDIKLLDKARQKNGLAPFTKDEIAELKTQIGDIDEIHGESAEDLYDGILAAVEQNVYHLVVIDSLGSIVSAAEAESESISEKQYGGASAVNTKFLRKLCSMLVMDDDFGVARETCIIGINQIRDAIGDPHKEYKSPGGRMLEHAKLVDLFVSSGTKIGAEEQVAAAGGTKKQWVQYGKEVNWRIEKGKAGIHEGDKGSYRFMFDIGTVDFYNDTIVAGVNMGVLEQAGSWLGFPDPEKPGEYLLRTQGKEAFAKALAEDAAAKAAAGDPDSWMNLIRSTCFKLADINVNYDEWT